MTRTKGFRVKIWKQPPGEPSDEPPADAGYLMEEGEPKLFATQRAARDAAQAYLEEEPELTYAIEPEVL